MVHGIDEINAECRTQNGDRISDKGKIFPAEEAKFFDYFFTKK